MNFELKRKSKYFWSSTHTLPFLSKSWNHKNKKEKERKLNQNNNQRVQLAKVHVCLLFHSSFRSHIQVWQQTEEPQNLETRKKEEKKRKEKENNPEKGEGKEKTKTNKRKTATEKRNSQGNCVLWILFSSLSFSCIFCFCFFFFFVFFLFFKVGVVCGRERESVCFDYPDCHFLSWMCFSISLDIQVSSVLLSELIWVWKCSL